MKSLKWYKNIAHVLYMYMCVYACVCSSKNTHNFLQILKGINLCPKRLIIYSRCRYQPFHPHQEFTRIKQLRFFRNYLLQCNILQTPMLQSLVLKLWHVHQQHLEDLLIYRLPGPIPGVSGVSDLVKSGVEPENLHF